MNRIVLENLAYTRKICVAAIKSCRHSVEMSIHQRIRDRRIALGITSYKALGALVGVSWQTVQLWEKDGGTAPNRSHMPAVVAALKTTSEWLSFGTGQEVVDDHGPSHTAKTSIPAQVPPPKWMDGDAFRLLELYYSLNERKRGDVMRLIEGLRTGSDATVANSKN